MQSVRRGTLFFEIERIAKEKKPKVLFLENVKGLLTHDGGKTIDVIIQSLSNIGYSIDFALINSKHYTPQNRERLFIVAVLNQNIEEWKLESLHTTIKKAKKRLLSSYNIKTFNFDFPNKKDVPYCLEDILEKEVEEKYFLDKEKTKEVLKHLEIKKEYKTDLHFVGGVTDKPNWLDNGKKLSRNYKQGSRIYAATGLSSTLSAQGVGGLGGHTGFYLLKNKTIRKLTPLECLKLQGFPNTYYKKLKNEGISDSQIYKMAGNAVTTFVIKDIFLQIYKQYF